eukprot:5163789-Amphidinium_carterae.1
MNNAPGCQLPKQMHFKVCRVATRMYPQTCLPTRNMLVRGRLTSSSNDISCSPSLGIFGVWRGPIGPCVETDNDLDCIPRVEDVASKTKLGDELQLS